MKVVISLSIVCCFLISCASIFSGSKQNVSVSSRPTNAKVTIDTRYIGQTPVIAELKKKENHTVQIELDGYQLAALAISKSVNGWWIAADVLLGSYLMPIYLVIDFATGAIYKLTPTEIVTTLDKEDFGYLSDGEMLFITVVLEPNPEWEVIGQLEPI